MQHYYFSVTLEPELPAEPGTVVAPLSHGLTRSRYLYKLLIDDDYLDRG